MDMVKDLVLMISVEDLRVMGRATQGVRLINIKGNDSIAAVAKVMKDEDAVDETDVKDMDVNPENGTALDTNENETE